VTVRPDEPGLVGLAGDIDAAAGARFERLAGSSPTRWAQAGLRAVGAGERAEHGDWTCHVFGRVDRRSRDAQQVAASLARRVNDDGERVLSELSGEFVALFWNGRRRTGFVAVDQLGGHSLYWAAVPGAVAFAVDLRDLLQLLPRTPSPDRTGVVRFLMDGTVAPAASMLTGVARLPGGRLLRLGPVDVARYWTPRYQGVLDATPDELKATVRRHIIDAVAARIPASRAVGVMLSGGLDSSTVAAAARASSQATVIHAYSGVFPCDVASDESELIELTTRRLGARTTASRVQAGRPLLGALDQVAAWGQIANAYGGFVWTPLIRRVAEDGISVLLDGQGGDELFGVAPYLVADQLRRRGIRAARAIVSQLPRVGEAPSRRTLDRGVRAYGLRAALPWSAQRVLNRLRDRRRPYPAWVAAADARQVTAAIDAWGWTREPGPRWWAHLAYALTDGRHALDMHGFLSRRTRQHGLRGGHPYLQDLRLVEFALRLPPASRLDPTLDRPLLRAAMRGLVPDEILGRTAKSNFSALFTAGIEADRPLATELITPRSALVAEFTRHPELVEELFARDPGAGALAGVQRAMEIWRVTSVEMWLRELAEPGFAAGVRATHGPSVEQAFAVH
jgi:asparagine synthase (glutamine-hydrolysing)